MTANRPGIFTGGQIVTRRSPTRFATTRAAQSGARSGARAHVERTWSKGTEIRACSPQWRPNPRQASECPVGPRAAVLAAVGIAAANAELLCDGLRARPAPSWSAHEIIALALRHGAQQRDWESRRRGLVGGSLDGVIFSCAASCRADRGRNPGSFPWGAMGWQRMCQSPWVCLPLEQLQGAAEASSGVAKSTAGRLDTLLVREMPQPRPCRGRPCARTNKTVHRLACCHSSAAHAHAPRRRSMPRCCPSLCLNLLPADS